jgi:hypothetical protein
LTTDDALLWTLKLERDAGRSIRAEYAGSSLAIPSRLPYQAHVALRYLALEVHKERDGLRAVGLELNVARELAERLGLMLVVGRQ